jgi:hypothetical protein
MNWTAIFGMITKALRLLMILKGHWGFFNVCTNQGGGEGGGRWPFLLREAEALKKRQENEAKASPEAQKIKGKRAKGF